MYNNIGGKIKSLALIVCWLGILVSVIGGVTLMGMRDTPILVGLIVVVLGSVFSWLGSLTTYGLGQLIENSDKLVETLEEVNDNIMTDKIEDNMTDSLP